MKKEVVYSLLAAAAFPGVAQANVTIKDAVNINQWTGAQRSTSDSVYVAAGGSLTKSLGTYVQGTYKLTISNIDASHGIVSVTAAGQTKETAAAAKGQTVELEFTLTEPTEVTITVASKQGQAFSIGTTTVEVVGDFYTAFNKKLTAATNWISTRGEGGINVYDKEPFNADSVQTYVAQTIEISEIIETFNGGTIDYETYTKHKLYSIDDDNPLMKQIAALLNNAATSYEKQLLSTVINSQAYKDAVKAFEDIKNETIKAKAQSAKEKLDKDVEAYKTGYEETASTYKYAEQLDTIKADITALDSAIAKATKDYADVEAAYQEVKDSITNAKGSYTTIIASTLGKTVSPFPYKPLQTQANKVVSELTNKLQAIANEADEVYNKGQIINKKKSLLDKIAPLAKQLADTTKYYTETLKGKLDAARTSYNTEVANDSVALKLYSDAVIAAHSKEKTALDNALTALYNKIDAANAGDCSALENLDITAEVQAVENAITAFKNACQPDQDKNTAVAAATTKIENLDKAFTTVKTTVNALKYGTTTAQPTYWPEWANNIDKFITESIKNVADSLAGDDAVKSNGKSAATYETFYNGDASTAGSLAQLISVATDSINNYNAKTVAAAAKYNSVDSALVVGNDSLTKAYNAVRILDVYNDTKYNHNGYDYKAAYTAAKAAYDKAVTAREKALALKEEPNADAVAALTYDNTDALNFLKEVEQYASSDQDAWQEVQDSVAAQARKKTANADYTALLANYNTVNNAVQAADKPLGLATDSIANLLKDIDTDSLRTDSINANADDAKAATINTYYKNVTNAKAKMKSILEAYNAAITKVKANAAAKKTATDAVTALKWDAQKATIIDDAGAAYTTPGTIAPVNEKDSIDNANTAIDKSIKEINELITNGDTLEILAKDYGNYYADSIAPKIDAAKTAIANADKLAKALAENFKAKTTLNTTFNTNLSDDIFTAAKNAAIAKDADAGDKFYAQKYIGVTLKGQADAIKKDIEKAYQAGTASAQSKTITKNITDLKALLDGSDDLAAANVKAYKSETTKGSVQYTEKSALDTLSTRSTELASKDESSQREAHQEWLAKQLQKINEQIAIDSAHYYAGEYDGTTGDYKASDNNALTGFTKEVIDSVSKWLNPTAYNEQITKDNNNMLSLIQSARDDAYAAYQRGVAEVEVYRNLKNATLQGAVNEAYNNFNEQLKPVPSDLDSVLQAANAELLATAAGQVFDKDSAYVTYFRNQKEAIVANDTAFVKDIRTALASVVQTTIDGYDTKVATATTTINGYNLTKDDKTSVLKDIKENIAKAKTALAQPDVAALDTYMEALADIDSQIATALNEAAKLDLEQPLIDAEENYDEGVKFLTNNSISIVEEFENFAKQTVKEARTYFDTASENATFESDYDKIRTKISEYNDSTRNPYLNYLTSNAVYESLNSLLQQQREIVDSTKNAIKNAPYLSYSQLDFETIEQNITSLQSEVDATKTTTLTKDERTALETRIKAVSATTLANEVSQTGNLKTKELEYINKRFSEFTAEYNTYAALGEEQAADAVASYKVYTTNDSIYKVVNALDSAYKILPYETELSAKLSEIVAKSGSTAISDAAKALSDSLQTVKGIVDALTISDDAITYNFAGDLQDQIEAINAEIASLQKEIDNSSNALFDKDVIAAEIEALKEEANNLARNVELVNNSGKNRAKYEADAIESLQTLIDEANKLVSESKTKISEKFTADAAQPEKYEAQYALCTELIAKDSLKLDSVTAEHAVYTNQRSLRSEFYDDIATITNYINDIKNNAAYQQALEVRDSVNILWNNYYNVIRYRYNDSKYFTTTAIGKNEANYQSVWNYYNNMYTNVSVGSPSFDDYDAWHAGLTDMQKAIDDAVKYYWNNILSVNSTDFNRIKNAVEGVTSEPNKNYDINGDGVFDIFDIQTAIKKGIK